MTDIFHETREMFFDIDSPLPVNSLMKIEIEIPGIKPLLSNHATKISTRGKHATKYKTDEAKEFEAYVTAYLSTKMYLFKDFIQHYDKTKHYAMVDFRFYLPIFTKKGLISEKSGDWDGFIKYTQDAIFDSLGIDDSQIIGGSSIKIHSKDYNIYASVTLKNLSTIK